MASEKSAKFRRDAARVFRVVVVGLFTAAVGVIVFGWWLGGWWGVAIGAMVAVVLLFAGMTAAVFLYAMSQDGA